MAINNQPFIKKFQVGTVKYIYDVNTNEIFGVNDVIYDIIDDIHQCDLQALVEKFKDKYSAAELEKNREEIKKAVKENDFFSASRPDIICQYTKNDVVYALNSKIYQLILELTNNCNLRCKYCAFSGRYHLNRVHGTEDMTFETAKKALILYMERCDSFADNQPAITFYGGEPLLQFELLKKIVCFVKSQEKGNRFAFSFTTNGTLLNLEIIKFLVEQNIGILVSLDGPREIHDRYRVYQNENGTFDTIMKNMQTIKDYSKDYFMKKVSFTATLAPPFNLNVFSDFFYGNNFFDSFSDKIRFSLVDPYETTFFKDFGLEGIAQEISREQFLYFENYKKSLLEGKYNDLTIEKQFFDKDFYAIVYRPMNRLRDKFIPVGNCFPGQRRLFVNTEGKLFICERVGASYQIGDVDNGFDFDATYRFLVNYAEFFKDCKYCWALRLCKKCYSDIHKGADFDETRKQQLCKSRLKSIERNLIAYCELKEKNPDAFAPFKDIIIG